MFYTKYEMLLRFYQRFPSSIYVSMQVPLLFNGVENRTSADQYELGNDVCTFQIFLVFAISDNVRHKCFHNRYPHTAWYNK